MSSKQCNIEYVSNNSIKDDRDRIYISTIRQIYQESLFVTINQSTVTM